MFVVDSLGSVGLVGLCAAVFDPIIFKIVLAVTIFCAIGFLITIIWSVAERLIYRHYKGSKWLLDILSARWKQIMGLLPFRVAIQIVHGTAISAWHGIILIMGQLKRLFHHSRKHNILIPVAVNNLWNIVSASVFRSSRVGS